MKKVILADGTVINRCTDSTTANSIFALRDTFAEAAAVRDLFNKENSKVIRIETEAGEEVTTGSNLVLLPDCILAEVPDGVQAEIKTRYKTEIELLQDEVTELQEVVIGG